MFSVMTASDRAAMSSRLIALPRLEVAASSCLLRERAAARLGKFLREGKSLISVTAPGLYRTARNIHHAFAALCMISWPLPGAYRN